MTPSAVTGTRLSAAGGLPEDPYLCDAGFRAGVLFAYRAMGIARSGTVTAIRVRGVPVRRIHATPRPLRRARGAADNAGRIPHESRHPGHCDRRTAVPFAHARHPRPR